MVFEYDQIVHKTIDGEDLEYQFLFGSEQIVFVKVGAGEDIDKYQDGFKRYIEIAERMRKVWGATVIIASNPDAPHAALDEKAIRWVASKLGYEEFKLYFWGISDGAYQNLKLAQKFPETVKFIGVNTSFITFADLEEKLQALPRVKKLLIYGTKDDEYDVVFPALRDKQNEYLKTIFVDGADHRFSEMPEQIICSVDLVYEDNSKRVWTNTDFTLMSSKMHPVMSAVNKLLFWVSDDETTLCVDVGEAFRGLRRPLRYLTVDDRMEMIHTFIESNLPDFHESVVCLILKMTRFGEDEHFVIDGRRLRKSFPKLGCICCKDNLEIADMDDEMCVLDPFDLGEMSFYLALDNDIPMANTFVRDLWALDHKWARFFREVARDYYRKPEDHQKVAPDSAMYNPTGMDQLFHIYLLGWYHAGDDICNEEDKVYVSAHKDFDKAVDLLPIRFQNCSVDEVADKLYWDYRHVEKEESPDYEQFTKVLQEAERIAPGVLDKMYDEGVIPRFE